MVPIHAETTEELTIEDKVPKGCHNSDNCKLSTDIMLDNTWTCGMSAQSQGNYIASGIVINSKWNKLPDLPKI